MDDLILYPTEAAQWHALLNEAQAARAVRLDDELESYLVFMMMRFVNAPIVPDTMLSVELLTSLQEVGEVRSTRLRDVGDRCLLVSGLFPDYLTTRQLHPSYLVNMGQIAYGTLSNEKREVATVYYALSAEFESYVRLLDTIRQTHFERS